MKSSKPSIFVMVDMEGISGIVHSPQVLAGEGGAIYQVARRYMTQDASACVDGCFRGGAGRVVVRDAHGAGFNMIWDEIDGRCELIQGHSGRQRMPRIEDFDALILLGYHAMAGTPQAILEHTMSSKTWQNLWINGTTSGELAIDAGIAGDHDIPTIMVSGDDKLCAEAQGLIPGIVAVEVKQGLDCQGGQLLGQDRAHELIRAGAARAVRNLKRIKAYKVASPVTFRLELVSRGAIPHRPNVKVIGGRTYEVTANTVEDALKAL